MRKRDGVSLVEREARLRRRCVAGVAALPPAVVLAACGAGGPAAPAAELSQPTRVEFLSRQPYDEAFGIAIDRFRARFPKAEVIRDHQPNNAAFTQKLETQVAAGTPPDVAFAIGSTYHAQAAQGFYEDLSPYIAKDKGFDLTDFVPFWLESGKWRGKQYFFPFDPGTTVMFWNKRIFAGAGVAAPDPRQAMTWQQFLEVALKVTKAPPAVPESQAHYGTALMAQNIWYHLPWQLGVEVFDKAFTQCRLNDPKAIEALQFAVDLRAKHGVWRAPGVAGPPTDFKAGNLATWHTGYWEAGPIRDRLRQAGEDFDVMPLPTFQGRPRLTIGWGSGNAMLAGSTRKAIAWEFVKHLSDKEVYEVLLEKGVMQPVRKSQQNSPAFRKNTPPYSFDVPVEDTKTARTPPFHPAMSELPGMVQAALDTAYAGKTAVQPLMDQLVPQINQKLAEYNSRFPER